MDFKKSGVIVTTREYEAVAEILSLPENYFKKNDKILSIGEGFSNFVQKLRDDEIEAFGLDPVYRIHGEEVNGEKIDIFDTSPAFLENKVNKVFSGAYFSNIKNTNPREPVSDKNGGIFLPSEEKFKLNPESLVAGSVYKIPFEEESFDKILLSRSFEHINFEKALPELMRVLKKDGEIRIGAPIIFILNNAKKLISKQFKVEEYSYEKNGTKRDENGFRLNYYFKENLNLGNSFNMLKDDEGISVYLEVQRASENKMDKAEAFFLENQCHGDKVVSVSSFVIRKDSVRPKFEEKDEIKIMKLQKKEKSIQSSTFGEMFSLEDLKKDE